MVNYARDLSDDFEPLSPSQEGEPITFTDCDGEIDVKEHNSDDPSGKAQKVIEAQLMPVLVTKDDYRKARLLEREDVVEATSDPIDADWEDIAGTTSGSSSNASSDNQCRRSLASLKMRLAVERRLQQIQERDQKVNSKKVPTSQDRLHGQPTGSQLRHVLTKKGKVAGGAGRKHKKKAVKRGRMPMGEEVDLPTHPLVEMLSQSLRCVPTHSCGSRPPVRSRSSIATVSVQVPSDTASSTSPDAPLGSSRPLGQYIDAICIAAAQVRATEDEHRETQEEATLWYHGLAAEQASSPMQWALGDAEGLDMHGDRPAEVPNERPLIMAAIYPGGDRGTYRVHFFQGDVDLSAASWCSPDFYDITMPSFSV